MHPPGTAKTATTRTRPRPRLRDRRSKHAPKNVRPSKTRRTHRRLKWCALRARCVRRARVCVCAVWPSVLSECVRAKEQRRNKQTKKSSKLVPLTHNFSSRSPYSRECSRSYAAPYVRGTSTQRERPFASKKRGNTGGSRTAARCFVIGPSHCHCSGVICECSWNRECSGRNRARQKKK